MHIENLSLINFKSYAQLEIHFDPKINCFFGLNGSGKTNLLDAVYYLSFCKSFFGTPDTGCIQHGKDLFVVQASYHVRNSNEHIFCGLKHGQKKSFKRNGKEYPKLSEHIGLLPIVMVSPNDSILITGGSEERRKFIDSVISQYDSHYLDSLIRYNRSLLQRNSMIKEFGRSGKIDRMVLEIIDDQLVMYGNIVFEKRQAFVQKLQSLFDRYYGEISGQREQVGIAYISQLSKGALGDLLKQSFEKDCILQYTTQGIHRDDIQFTIDQHPVRKFGSQGQQKSFLLSLKLSQFDFINEVTSVKPLLLLDDIFDKLDESRVKNLMQLVANNQFGQIFITETSISRLRAAMHGIDDSSCCFFEVNDGEIRKYEE